MIDHPPRATGRNDQQDVHLSMYTFLLSKLNFHPDDWLSVLPSSAEGASFEE
jgi:hypothetical protein